MRQAEERLLMLQQQAGTALAAQEWAQVEKLAVQIEQCGAEEAAARAAELRVSLAVEQMQPEAAQAALTQLAALAPGNAYTIFLTARVRFMLGERTSLLPLLAQAREPRRGASASLREKIYNLEGNIYRRVGDAMQAAKSYHKAIKYAATQDARAIDYSNYLFNLHYLPLKPQELLQESRGYGELFHTVQPLWLRRAEPKELLTIGYLSPDVRNHVVLRFSLAMFAHYNRDKFCVIIYMSGNEDTLSGKVRGMVDGWRSVRGWNAARIAEQIADDGVDILVELAGHTQGGGLPVLAYKPAPVQLTGIGYFAPSGLSAVDYMLGDRYLDEVQEKEAFPQIVASPEFDERVLALGKSHFCYTPLQHSPEPHGTPCLQRGYVTFGSFNNFTKVNDEVLTVWGRLLQLVPGSRLLLKAALCGSEEGRKLITARLDKLGIETARVELRGMTVEYLQEYADVDIALDTFPYPGGGTTCDALYMGVPVVAMAGKTHGQRFGRSLLINVGLGELVAADEEEYLARATALASDYETLNLLHLNLRKMMQASPVMDGAGYVRELEAGYRLVWEDYCKQQRMLTPEEANKLVPRLQQVWEQKKKREALAMADAILTVATTPQTCELVARVYAELQDAKALCAAEKFVTVSGGSSYAHILLGRAAEQAGDWLRAKAEIQLALADKDMKSDLLCQKAVSAAEQEHWSEALCYAEMVLQEAQAEEYPLARYIYGLALRGTVRHVEAVEALTQAVQAAEHCLDLEIWQEALTVLAQEERILGRADAAAGHYLQAAQLAARRKSVQEAAGLYSSYLLSGAQATGREEKFFQAHLGFGELVRPLLPDPLPARGRVQHRRLRLGLLSADLRQHVMFPFLFPLLVHLKREKFELYCYYLGTEHDGCTAQAKARAENWREAANISPVALAELLRQDEIDIACDFSGHSCGSGLAALLLRPAPLQLSGLGYMATTGLREIDYFLTDAYLDAQEDKHERFFTEKLLRLTSHLCYTGRSDVPVPRGTPAKRRGFLLFGVFNHYYKYTDEMLVAWRNILEAVPQAKLLLKCQLYVSASAVDMVKERLTQLGFDLARVIFEPATRDYLIRYLDVDIALDTYPYPGGGTTCDALYMGVPVVTRYGRTHGSRFGLSILQNAGLGELCTATAEEYQARAIMLAADYEMLDALHRGLRGMLQKSPVMDGKRWTHELEQGLLQAWEDFNK